MDKSITTQVERVIKLYHALPREPQEACSIEEIKQYVRSFYDNEDEKSLSKKIRRDLTRLNNILVTGTIECNVIKGNQPDKFILSANASIEKQNPELALVLVMASNYLSQYIPNEIYEKVEGFFISAQEQLERNTKLSDWNSRIRFVTSGYNNSNHQIQNEEEISRIYTALLDDELWLQVLYRKEGSDEQTEYTLKPHGMIQHGKKQYLMASKIIGQKSELRTFNMQRFDEVEIVEQCISVDVNTYDLVDLIEEKEYENAHFERVELDIKLRCENYLQDELQENPLDFSQNTEEADEEGYFNLTATCKVTNSLMDWLIEKSHAVKVVEPQELYEKVRCHVFNAMLNYDTELLDVDSNHYQYSLESNKDMLTDEIDE